MQSMYYSTIHTCIYKYVHTSKGHPVTSRQGPQWRQSYSSTHTKLRRQMEMVTATPQLLCPREIDPVPIIQHAVT